MYYQNYEEYMRQVLGYPINDPNIYEIADYRSSENTYNTNQNQTNLTDDEIKQWYPDIYNKIYPIICRVCESNTQPINQECIERMTDEVYNEVESNDTIVNVTIQTRKENNSTEPKKLRTTDIRRERMARREEVRTERTERKESSLQVREESQNRDLRQRNPLLRDLIKILILRQLLSESRPNRSISPHTSFSPTGLGIRPPLPVNRPTMRPMLNREDISKTNYLEF